MLNEQQTISRPCIITYADLVPVSKNKQRRAITTRRKRTRRRLPHYFVETETFAAQDFSGAAAMQCATISWCRGGTVTGMRKVVVLTDAFVLPDRSTVIVAGSLF